MSNFVFRFKKKSKYGNEVERENIVSSTTDLEAMNAFKKCFPARKYEVMSMKNEKGKELLKV